MKKKNGLFDHLLNESNQIYPKSFKFPKKKKRVKFDDFFPLKLSSLQKNQNN